MKNFKVYLLTIITLLILVSCKSDDNPIEPKIPENKGMPCPDIPTVTYGGQTYHTVQIGKQCWFKENLNIGTMIKSTKGGYQQKDNGVIEKYCYNNDANNCKKYGGLYEWPEAMEYVKTEGAKGICPSGWHIPTKAEFETLKKYVNNKPEKLVAKGEKGNPTNETGFSALFAGYRYYYNGGFDDIGDATNIWSSTKYDTYHAYSVFLFYYFGNVRFDHLSKNLGFSVRCIKD